MSTLLIKWYLLFLKSLQLWIREHSPASSAPPVIQGTVQTPRVHKTQSSKLLMMREPCNVLVSRKHDSEILVLWRHQLDGFEVLRGSRKKVQLGGWERIVVWICICGLIIWVTLWWAKVWYLWTENTWLGSEHVRATLIMLQVLGILPKGIQQRGVL